VIVLTDVQFSHWIIAEQKTKDSVGKENGMNLSDHESSESDGDTDAMCGNGDGYLHSYVPLMTKFATYAS
jgi:hypothetical protein